MRASPKPKLENYESVQHKLQFSGIKKGAKISFHRHFKDLSQLPNIVGVIDGTHLLINAPCESAVDYFSHYQHHDFGIQAVNDRNLLFLYFSAGYQGSMHDAHM